MKVFLHIGTEKTGTTTLQSFLAENRKPLRKQRVLFPTSMGDTCQFKLAVFARQDAKVHDLKSFIGVDKDMDAGLLRDRIRSELYREVAKAHPDVLILSNEHCSSRLTEASHVAQLHDLLTELSDDVTIVVYLREQGDLLLSHYSTAVKAGHTATLKQFLSQRLRLLTTADRAFFDYSLLLARWADVFGKDRLAVRVFERESLVGADVVQDFLSVAGIPGDDLWHPEAANLRLDAYTTEFLRHFNRHVPYLVDNRRNEMRDGLHSLLEELATGPALTVDGLDEFADLFRKSNAQVARNYLARTDGVLFRCPRKKSDNFVKSQHITIEQAVEMAAQLWMRQQQEIVLLRRELNGRRKHRRGARRAAETAANALAGTDNIGLASSMQTDA